MARRYQMQKRAEHVAETRRRIVEATVRLHSTVGPARTSVSAIAEAAGVQRATVYAHFPDEPSLFAACSAHWAELHPFPDPDAWAAVADPEERLERALHELYRWYEEVEPDLEVFRRDASLHPLDGELIRRADDELAAVGDLLARGFPRRKPVRAAIGHALEFETWRSLVRRQGLARRDAVDAMVRLVRSV